MARVKSLPYSDLPTDIRGVVEKYGTSYGPFGNQAQVLAHVAPAAHHLAAMLMELKARQGITWRYIELAVVVVSKLNACDYCVAHHSPHLRVDGLSEAGLETLLEYENHPELDDVDKLVVEYAIAVTNNAGKIRDKMFERLHAVFSEAQIVELTLRISLCGFFNRFNDALMIEIEEELVGG
jgi:uncharacterized peroxidase-related enzyme